MNEKTEAQIYELSDYEPLTKVAQCEWSAIHIKDTAALKLAAQVWGGNTKAMAFCWNHWRADLEGADLFQILSLVQIATLNKFERPLLYDQWKDTTMSFSQVREAVAARKQRKSKQTKEPKTCKHCGGIL